MPVTVASLEALLTLSKEGFDKGLSGAKSALGKLGPVAGVAGAGIAAGIGVGVAAVGAVGATAFKVADDVDDATASMAASLGISKEAAGEFKDEMKDIFAAGFGENFEEVGQAIALVQKSIDGIDDKSLKDLAQGALALEDNFDKDVNETVDAASVLMKEFGLTGQQALDFISKGLQSGLDRNGDFLDSIREYGNLFGDAGFEAGQFFSLMETGAEGGALGTDKISDAIKEFQIRANEGSDDVREAFAAMGMDFDRISGFIASGDETWADYFKNVTAGLNEIEDPLERARLQTALFGTQAEDLGVSFTEGLSDSKTTLEDMAGATDALNVKYDNLGDALEGLGRKGKVALEPLGAGMLDAINSVMPQVTAFFDNVLGPAIERFGTQAGPIFAEFVDKLTTTVGPAMELISDALKRINIAFGGTGENVDFINTILGVLDGILDAIIIGIQATALAFQGIAWAVEQVSAGVKTVIGWFDTLGNKLDGLGDAIPDWLKPGSPPPLAIGLADIASQLQSMPDMSRALSFDGAGALPQEAAVAGAGGGSVGGLTVIVQGNVYGDSHLEQIMGDAMGQLQAAITAGAR